MTETKVPSVLCMHPPAVPTYFNAGHHLSLWEVGAYLRKCLANLQIDILDAGVLNCTWKEVADLLINSYDSLIIVNEFDNLDGIQRLIEYARAISPSTKILTFGRVSSLIPKHFEGYDLDGIIVSGDPECGALDFIKWSLGELDRSSAAGLLLRQDERWWETNCGQFLLADEWAYPPTEEIPFGDYTRISTRPENRFSALPGLRELTVSIARGCPVGCNYCLVPIAQGRKERRRSVQSVIDYIREARNIVNFDYVSFYAPTFTLQRDWVLQFCESVQMMNVPWKCCTTVRHLDKELVTVMGRGGCTRISVGLETLDPNAFVDLPKAKRTTDQRISDVAEWCRDADIELNCFVMLGMPGQTSDGVRHTFDLLKRLNARIRPTAYTPYHRLTEDSDAHSLITFFSRQVVQHPAVRGLTHQEFYSLEFSAGD